MSKSSTIYILVLSMTISFIGGVYYGVKQSIYHLGLLEQIIQGALSRHQLLAIDKGEMDLVKFYFELDIDTGLHRYTVYNKSANKPFAEFFFPELTPNLDQYVDFMVDYRRDHPIVYSSTWALPSVKDDKETRLWREKDLKESQKMLNEIKQLLRERGVPESALSSK